MYAAAFLDHFRRPRGQGALPAPTHRGRGVDPACGDELEIDLEVAGDRIRAARFRARGCAGAVAVGSALSSLLPGRAARADAVSREDLTAALGDVPAAKRHALRLALDVLRRALESPRT